MWYIIGLIILVIGLIICLLPERWFKKIYNGSIGAMLFAVGVDLIVFRGIYDLIYWLRGVFGWL